MNMTSQQLAAAISNALLAVSTDPDQKHLSGVRLEHNGKALSVTATDGHRLHTTRIEYESSAFECALSAAVAKDCAAEMKRRGKLGFECRSTAQGVYIDSTLYASADLGRLPWRQVVPQTYLSRGLVDAEALALVASPAAKVNKQSRGLIYWTQDALCVKATHSSGAEIRGTVPTASTVKTECQGVNLSYLAAAAKACGETLCSIEQSGELDPIVVRTVRTEGGFTAVIMPVRL